MRICTNVLHLFRDNSTHLRVYLCNSLVYVSCICTFVCIVNNITIFSDITEYLTSAIPFQVNRPMSMKKDGIQTRKRKPKTPSKSKSPTTKERAAPHPVHIDHEQSVSPLYTPQMAAPAQQRHHQQQTGLLDLSVTRSDNNNVSHSGMRILRGFVYWSTFQVSVSNLCDVFVKHWCPRREQSPIIWCPLKRFHIKVQY